MFMNSEEAKNMIFHNRKENLFWGSFLPHFFNQLFLPVTVSGVVLNLENHSKNEIRAVWKTFFEASQYFTPWPKNVK